MLKQSFWQGFRSRWTLARGPTVRLVRLLVSSIPPRTHDRGPGYRTSACSRRGAVDVLYCEQWNAAHSVKWTVMCRLSLTRTAHGKGAATATATAATATPTTKASATATMLAVKMAILAGLRGGQGCVGGECSVRSGSWEGLMLRRPALQPC